MASAPSITVSLPGYPFTNLPVANNIAALRSVSAATITAPSSYLVSGAVTPGDGAGNLFTWQPGSSANDDGATVIRPNDLTALQSGRWLASFGSAFPFQQALAAAGGSALVGYQATSNGTTRNLQVKLREMQLSVKDFGAVGNGTTNDTAAIQAAINFAQLTKASLYFPASVYLVTSLMITAPIGIIGDGSSRSVVMSSSPTADVFSCGNPLSAFQGLFFSGLSVTRAVLPTPGVLAAGIKYVNIPLPQFEDVMTLDHAIGIYGQTGSPGAFLNNCVFGRTAPAVNSTDIYYGFRSIGDLNFTINGFKTASIGWFHNGEGSLDYGAESYGFHISGNDMRDLWFRSCAADNTQYGMTLDGTTTGTNPYATPGQNLNWDMRLVDCSFDSCKLVGLQMVNITITGCISIVGGWSNPINASDQACTGILLDNVSGVTITGAMFFVGQSRTNYNSIVCKRGTSNVTITGCHFHYGNGILLDGTTNGVRNVTITGNNFYYADGRTAQYAVRLVSANRVAINGNSFGGRTATPNACATAVLIDPGSDYVAAFGNVCETTAYTATLNNTGGTHVVFATGNNPGF